MTVAITKYDGRKMWKGREPDTKRGCKDRSGGDQQSDAMYFRRGGVLSKENLN